MLLSPPSFAGVAPRAVLCIALFAAIVPGALAAKAKTRAKPEVSDVDAFRGAIVMDAASGKVLFEDRADVVTPPASMTKLMTYAVLWDKLQSGKLTLDAPVKIDRTDSKVGGTQVFLDPRETFPVEDLIYAMIIPSANDAAHALARFASGSIPAFVAEMNAKARELGMTHSTFRTPNGLPPDSRQRADSDLSTPRDYAILCRYLLLHTDILKYSSVPHREFAPNRPKGPMKMDNHNKLLGHGGIDGLKTGYTLDAGYCLSATAERNGHRIIVVIMGSFGPGHSVDMGRTRDRKTDELMERGFAALPVGTSDFATERAKYVSPAAIPLDTPVTSPKAGDGKTSPTDEAPSIKLSLPRK